MLRRAMAARCRDPLGRPQQFRKAAQSAWGLDTDRVRGIAVEYLYAPLTIFLKVNHLQTVFTGKTWNDLRSGYQNLLAR